MSCIRITGLVREARRAQEALRAGVAPAERAGFLARVREAVATAERILAEHGTGERDLPGPSRVALIALRKIAALPEHDLPERDAGRAPAVRARVRNVVRCLDGCLEPLAEGTADRAVLDRARARARSLADDVERLCREQGASPAALPVRSRRAYSMLRWVGEGENVERYAAQARLVVGAFRRPDVVEMRRGAGLPDPGRVRVRFECGRFLSRLRRTVRGLEATLSVGFLAAEEDDLRSLVLRASLRDRVPAEDRDRHFAFVESEEFAALSTEVDLLAEPGPRRARGRAYDLDALYERLDARWFHGSLSRPRLHWATSLSHRLFGCYVKGLHLVCMNPLLDDPTVPEFVAEFVLYHELLHVKHPAVLSGGRRLVHGHAFRAEERLFPRWREAEDWTKRLARAAAGHDDVDADGLEGADDEADDAIDAPPARERPSPDENSSRRTPPAVPAAPPSPPPAHRPGRNDPCRCGSGRKYKRCHLADDESAAARTHHPR